MPNKGSGHEHAADGERKPRILYLLSDLGIPLYSSVKAGGVHARAMIRAFLDEGAEVEVIVLRSGKGREHLPPSVTVRTASQGRLRRRWARRYRFRTAPVWATGVEALLAQRDFLKCARKVLKSGPAPDLVYARHSWLPSSIPRIRSLAGKPLYLEVNALFAREKSERGELAFPRLTRRLEKKALRSARRILPVTPALSTSIQHLGISEDRIRVTPNGVDLDLFSPEFRNAAPRNTNAKFMIGLASSFRHYHGIRTLIRAAALLEERIGPVHLRLIGDGPMRSSVEGMARAAGLRGEVELPGPVAHQEMPPLLAVCDVCVAPYEGDRNLYNCPMKLFEYMALKTPIVASAWGEIPKFLEHEGTALLHEAGSPESLYSMLLQVFERPEEAQARAERAYEAVHAHTWRGHARWILEDALSRGGSNA